MLQHLSKLSRGGVKRPQHRLFERKINVSLDKSCDRLIGALGFELCMKTIGFSLKKTRKNKSINTHALSCLHNFGPIYFIVTVSFHQTDEDQRFSILYKRLFTVFNVRFQRFS